MNTNGHRSMLSAKRGTRSADCGRRKVRSAERRNGERRNADGGWRRNGGSFGHGPAGGVAAGPAVPPYLGPGIHFFTTPKLINGRKEP